jgi:hypothetical protein
MAYGSAMGRPGEGKLIAAAFSAVLLAGLLVTSTASAHVAKDSGPFRVELGWGVEPPLTGLDNFVQVEVAESAGAPVAVPAGALSVEVAYGASAVTLPLVPAAAPGELRAELVPTRPGTYAFHVGGTVGGRALEVSATCSEATFECVEDASGTEFPVSDPSSGELAQRLVRESGRVRQTGDDADSARSLAVVALALAAAALATAVGVGVGARRKRGRP